jgi:hypothetical protein
MEMKENQCGIKLTNCPKCGVKFSVGTSRCWEKNCDYVRDKHHNWAGCICIECGKTRDEQHHFEHCKCNVCGKIKHNYENGICKKCGQKDEFYIKPINVNTVKEEDRFWENPELARHTLIDYLKTRSPYISTYSLRSSFNYLNEKNDIKLAKQFMFFDDWNLILGSTDAMRRLGVKIDEIYNIYQDGLNDPKKRNIAILALERLGYVPKDDEERFLFFLKHSKYDELNKEMPERVNVLFELLSKERDTFILREGIKIIAAHYSSSYNTQLLNLLKNNPSPDTAELLSKNKVKESIPYLMKIIEEKEKEERNYTVPAYIKALSEFKEDGSIDLFLRLAIEHPDDEIHKSAVFALANIGNPKVLPPILQRYISEKNEFGNYSFPIRDTLILYGQDAIPYFVNELENENIGIRNIVIENLKKLYWKPNNEDEKDLFEGKLTKKTALSFLESNNIDSCLKAMDYFLHKKDSSIVFKIVPFLKSDIRKIQEKAYYVLKSFNWTPVEQIDKIYFSILAKNWNSLIDIGQPAVRQLLVEMKRLEVENIWNPDIRKIMDTVSKIPDLTESNLDLLKKLVDDGYFQDFALNEIGKKGNTAIDSLIEMLNYNGYEKSKALNKVITYLTKFNSNNIHISLIKAMPQLDKDLNEIIVAYLLKNKKEIYAKEFMAALGETINKLFTKLSQGYDYSIILKKLGADENKIIDVCIELLTKLERPIGYENILEFFIYIKSNRVVRPIINLIKIPKPGAEKFYKDLVRTIGKIEDKSALPYLYDLLATKWQIIGERSGPRIIDSKWIELEINLAIDTINNSTVINKIEIETVCKMPSKSKWWLFWQ